jgi:arginine-tRNA-protein transferase
MQSLFTFTSPPLECAYLPDQTMRLHYEIVGELTDEEYQQRLAQGWRHFGFSLFRPRCPHCQACQSLRVDVDRFRPNRSQRRSWQMNRDLTVTVGAPSVTEEKLDLYDRFHAFQVAHRAWPEHLPKEESSYVESFVDSPVATREWSYLVGDKLVGVGYVDHLPNALSAIYFFYDPAERRRSLGTFNVLNILAQAASNGVPHVYLGYFVEGCPSLEYKANFVPNQVVTPAGTWIDFRV